MVLYTKINETDNYIRLILKFKPQKCQYCQLLSFTRKLELARWSVLKEVEIFVFRSN